jgi:hypothetical protein
MKILCDVQDCDNLAVIFHEAPKEVTVSNRQRSHSINTSKNCSYYATCKTHFNNATRMPEYRKWGKFFRVISEDEYIVGKIMII